MKQVAILAAGQFGVITRRQLRELGLSRSAIATWVRHGRLTPLHRGVYLVGAVLPPLGAEKAAVLACGPRSVLSHWSAAHLLALPDCPPASEPQLIVPLGGSSGRPGIRIYRTDSLMQSEVRQVRGLPVTTSSRTLLDLAATSPGPATRGGWSAWSLRHWTRGW